MNELRRILENLIDEGDTALSGVHSFNIDYAEKAIRQWAKAQEYCKCTEPAVRLKSFCRLCDKEIENPKGLLDLVNDEDEQTLKNLED